MQIEIIYVLLPSYFLFRSLSCFNHGLCRSSSFLLRCINGRYVESGCSSYVPGVAVVERQDKHCFLGGRILYQVLFRIIKLGQSRSSPHSSSRIVTCCMLIYRGKQELRYGFVWKQILRFLELNSSFAFASISYPAVNSFCGYWCSCM